MIQAHQFMAIALLVTTISACAISPTQTQSTHSQPMSRNASGFIQTNYDAADALNDSASQRRELSKSMPILVATLVNIDSLTESSRLGRIISEQLQARLSQHGYAVVELKIRGNLFVKQDQGELLLSREIRDITTSHKAQAVVVGTYAVASNNIFINLKVVGTDNIIVGTYDYMLQIDPDTRALLNGKR